MSCDDPTFNQTLCQNVTNAGNVQMIKFMSRQIKGLRALIYYHCEGQGSNMG